MQTATYRLTSVTTLVATLGLLIAALFVIPQPAHAAKVCQCNNPDQITQTTCADDAECTVKCGKQASNPGVDRGGRCIDSISDQPGGTGSGGTSSATELVNPLAGACPSGADGQKCVQLIIGSIIKAIMGIIGSVALLMVVYGGILWLTSGGNSERIQKGKTVLIWSVLGLILIFGAYSLTSFVIGKISGTDTSSPTSSTSGPATPAKLPKDAACSGDAECQSNHCIPIEQKCS